MSADLPPPAHDLRHLDPEVRKERVKLATNAFNAVGPGILIGIGLILVAVFVLRYMKVKETA